MTLKTIRRSSLAVLTISDRIRAIKALKMIQAMTIAHGSSAEDCMLSEIADYWAIKDGDSNSTLEFR